MFCGFLDPAFSIAGRKTFYSHFFHSILFLLHSVKLYTTLLRIMGLFLFYVTNCISSLFCEYSNTLKVKNKILCYVCYRYQEHLGHNFKLRHCHIRIQTIPLHIQTTQLIGNTDQEAIQLRGAPRGKQE